MRSQPLARLTGSWPVILLTHLAALLSVVVLTKALSVPLVPAAPSPFHEPLATARNILQTVAMIGAYALLIRRIERREASEVALRPAEPSLLSGVLIGMGLIGLVYSILFGLGVARFGAGTGLTGLVVALLKPLVIGILEELVFRAIIFRILQQVGGTLAATLVSAALFGIAHAGNPGATPLAIAFLTVELGVLLALVYALTDSLWIVAGIHMGWNLMQGFVFGSDVSGLQSPNAVLPTSFDGPDWLTGGAFGPEGSIVTLGVSLVGITITLWLIVRQRLWQPRRFELRADRAAG